MSPVYRARPARAGFTLTELLIVILIIAMLIGLLVTALGPAILGGRQAGHAMMLSQIQQGLVARYPDGYPPSMSNDPQTNIQRLLVWLRKEYPQAVRIQNRLAPPQLQTNLGQLTEIPSLGHLDFASMDAAESWVFFLGGMPELVVDAGTGQQGWILTGFANDPTNPFAPRAMNPSRTNVAFAFEQGVLRDLDGDGWPEFYLSETTQAPVVYFRSQDYLDPTRQFTAAYSIPPLMQRIGVAAPYVRAISQTGLEFHNPDTCQLITAGEDGVFGFNPMAAGGAPHPMALQNLQASGHYPPQATLESARILGPGRVSEFDLDNVTNLEGTTIGGMMP